MKARPFEGITSLSHLKVKNNRVFIGKFMSGIRPCQMAV